MKRQFWRGLALAASALLAACAAPCDYGQGDVLAVAMINRKPIVSVEVNHNRVPFLVDTGASATALTPEGAAVLQLPSDRLRTTRILGVGGESREQNALLSQLRIGGRELRNLTLPVVTHGQPGQRVMVGIIGADFLRASDVDIDLQDHRVTLHGMNACRAAAPPWQGAYETIPLELLPTGQVRLRVRVNGTSIWAILDTGATHTAIRRSTALRLNVPEEVLSGKPIGMAHGIGTDLVELRVHSFEKIEIGGEVLRDIPVGIIDLDNAYPFGMILGMDYIGARRLWLSYAQQRLYVQPAGLVPR